jgi:hypothetical protein
MSYDLYFFQNADNPLDREAISRYLSDNLTAKSAKFDQWLLENERTGVHYLLGFEEVGAGNSDDDDEEGLPVFAGNVFTGLVMHVNFGRPDFFGLEAFQFVDQLMNDLRLLVYDPQVKGDDDRLIRPTQEELFENWSGTNSWATDSFRKDSPDAFTYVPAEKSNKLWRYNFQVEELQRQLGEDIFVPSAFFLKRKTDGSVVTAATWVAGIAQLIPPVEFFAVVRERKKLFRAAVDEKGLISRETMMATFGEYLREVHVDGCQILYPKQGEALTEKFGSIKFEHELNEFVRLEGAALTNVPEPADGSQQRVV